MYWNGNSYDMGYFGKEFDIVSVARNLETTLVTKKGICEHCGEPHKYEYGSIKDEYKNRPYFFGVFAHNANIGSAILLNGTRPILDDYLQDNFKNGDVTIEAIYIPKAEYNMWLYDEITLDVAIQGAYTSIIGFTGTNIYGPTSGENIAVENPTGYLFATIVPEMERNTLILFDHYFYVLIRVNRHGEITYLNNIKDTSTLLPESEHERNKFTIYIIYDYDLYNRQGHEKNESILNNRPSQEKMRIAVIASLLFTLGFLTYAWLSMKLRNARLSSRF